MLETDDKIPFTEHLEELRKRIMISGITVFVLFFPAYYFKEKLYGLLMYPAVNQMKIMNTGKFIYTGPAELFFTYIKVSFLTALLAASPVILYQFWMFVAPGLYDKEKKLLMPVLFLSTFFFVGGALFGYFVVFPYGFSFFLGFSTDFIDPLFSVKEYLSFASMLLIAFGCVFELPLVITFMARIGIVTVSFLQKQRKYAILAIFVLAAILTPPDVVTQILLAMPMVILYEISIIGAKIFGKKKVEDDVESAETNSAV